MGRTCGDDSSMEADEAHRDEDNGEAANGNEEGKRGSGVLSVSPPRPPVGVEGDKGRTERSAVPPPASLGSSSSFRGRGEGTSSSFSPPFANGGRLKSSTRRRRFESSPCRGIPPAESRMDEPKE